MDEQRIREIVREELATMKGAVLMETAIEIKGQFSVKGRIDMENVEKIISGHLRANCNPDDLICK